MTTSWAHIYTGFNAFYNNGADPTLTNNLLAAVKNQSSGSASTVLHTALNDLTNNRHQNHISYSDSQVTLKVKNNEGPDANRDRSELESVRYLEADRKFQFDFDFEYNVDDLDQANDANGEDAGENTSVDVVIAQLNQPFLGEVGDRKISPIFALSLNETTLRVKIASTIGDQDDAEITRYEIGQVAEGEVYSVSTEFEFSSTDPYDSYFKIVVKNDSGVVIGSAEQLVSQPETGPAQYNAAFGNYHKTTTGQHNFYDGQSDPVAGGLPPHLRIGAYRDRPDNEEEIAVTFTNFVATSETASAPVINGTAGNDTLTASRLDFREGDVLNGLGGNDSLTGEYGDDTLNGGAGNDTLDGSLGNDNLSGGTHNDSLLGGAGHDTLDGGNGFDTLEGGAGNDWLMASYGVDSMDGGAGIDMLSYANINYGASTVAGVTISMSAMTYTSIEGVTGSGSRDSLTGDGGDNRLRGLTGDDSLYGEGGNDTLDGGNSNDSLVGGLGGDLLLGGNGQDTLYGQTGHDTLDGGAGNDAFYGGSGNDLFIFASGSGTDAILDFDIDDDTIRLEGFGSDTPEIDAFNGIATLSFVSGDLLTVSYTGDWGNADLIFA